jgi:replicative DNA helicase
MLIDKPVAEEAEHNVLGAFMIDGLKTDKVITVFESTTENDFYTEANKIIFNVIADLYSKNISPDLVSVANRINDKRKYLSDIVKNCIGTANIEYYSRLIKEKAIERNHIDVFTMAINTISDKSLSHEEKLDYVGAILKGLETDTINDEPMHISEAAQMAVDDISDIMNGVKEFGYKTGLTRLDDHIGGISNGNLVVIGGRPSEGKSTLGLNIAEFIASQQVNTHFITMEMPEKEVGGRSLCSQGRADNRVLKTPNSYIESENTKLQTGIVNLNKMQLYIKRMSRPSVNQVKAYIRSQYRKNGLQCVVVDHLHIMNNGHRDGEIKGIQVTTSTLKALALELNIPIILLAQLNRSSKTENRMPNLTDFRGGGAIEEDADIAILIHRDDNDPEMEGKSLAILGKNRSGERNVAVVMANNLQYFRFDNYANFDETY